jgi:hypothetical protein
LLTHPDSRTADANTPPRAHARKVLAAKITQTLWRNDRQSVASQHNYLVAATPKSLSSCQPHGIDLVADRPHGMDVLSGGVGQIWEAMKPGAE